jgi:4-hydroxy-2-oxoheptanedioate aldolase
VGSAVARVSQWSARTDYLDIADDEVCLLVQAETVAAMQNLEAICAVDGVDGVFIGPADLHASMGLMGEIANPKVMPIIDEAIRRVRRSGKAPGILTPSEEHARRQLGCGALFVAVGSDIGILARGAEALAAKFKS